MFGFGNSLAGIDRADLELALSRLREESGDWRKELSLLRRKAAATSSATAMGQALKGAGYKVRRSSVARWPRVSGARISRVEVGREARPVWGVA